MRKQRSAPRRTCPEVLSEDLSPDLRGRESAARPSCPTGTPVRTGEPHETASVLRSRLLTCKPSQRVLYGHAVLLNGWLRELQAGQGAAAHGSALPTRWLPKEDGDDLEAEAQVQTSAAPFHFSFRLAKGTRDLDLELLGQPGLTQRYRRPRAVATLKSPS